MADPPRNGASGSGVVAAIDVGTNSFHLLVARVSGHDRFEVLTQEKQVVRLGQGPGEMKRLSPEAMDRGVASLAHLRRLADAHGAASVRAVATSATREADNHDEFIERARLEADVDLEVISGVEEARLIHLGVLQGLPVFDRRILVADIGGGSTEVVVGERGEVLAAASLKLGAVRLTNRFFPDEAVTKAQVAACRGHVRSLLVSVDRTVERLGYDTAIGSSGTVEQVVRLALAERGGDVPRTWNGTAVDADEIGAVVAALVKARRAGPLSGYPGLEPKRADIILAGALVLEGLVEVLGIRQLTYSDFALREGVLLDTIQRHGGGLHVLGDVARRSVDALMEACDEDPEHSRRVASLAVALHDDLAGDLGLGRTSRDLLEAGALLANVGLTVSHTRHHKHSYYVIRHSDRLVGFTDNEIEVIAQIARYHRKSPPKEGHPEFAALGTGPRHVVRTCAALLRVAIGLDRGHAGRVAAVRARVDGDEVVVEVTPAAPDVDLTLERYVADERKGLLEEVAGRPVRIEVADPAR